MTIFRPQRGTLAESLADQFTVENLRDLANKLGVDDLANIRTDFYGWDARIDWHTHVVIVQGKAVGFTNGKL